MDALIIRYNSIFELPVIETLKSFGINCIESMSGSGNSSSNNRIDVISNEVLSRIESGNPLLFVFSINFFPDISEVCQKLGVLYVCWSVDCPVLELFTNSIKNPCNRIFLFDYAQYERVSQYNPDCIYYLPLATDIKRWDNVLSNISSAEEGKYMSDISFVGSLYTEKNEMSSINLNPYAQGFIDGLLQSQMNIYGSFFLEKCLPDEITEQIVKKDSFQSLTGFVEPVEKYIAANNYLGFQLAAMERTKIISTLSEKYDLKLYTNSNTTSYPHIKNCGPAKTFSEMPKIFNLSKINLNITMRPISTGLPLRIFDVLGCRGFLLTNYQEEIFEYFEPGVDLDVFSSIDELVDKCDYYLTHEEIRKKIALNGYKKIVESHSIENRIAQLISYIVN